MEETYLKVLIEKSKVEIYRNRHCFLFLTLIRTGFYHSQTGIEAISEKYFFNAITYFKLSIEHRLRKLKVPFSYFYSMLALLEKRI